MTLIENSYILYLFSNIFKAIKLLKNKQIIIFEFNYWIVA